MQIKRYEAATLQEASARIKKELGPDAIILSMKKISDNPSQIEVMAARDEETGLSADTNATSPDLQTIDNKEQRDSELLCSLVKEIHELKSSVEGLKQKFSYQRDLSDLKETMNVLLDNISVRYPVHLRDIYMRMVANGISRFKAAELVEAIKKHDPHEETGNYEKSAVIAEKLIAASFAKDHRKEPRIKAFIGPTGVGKTTTLAKLAAHYSLEKKMKVGMVTTDTYRIAATDQLKVYAKIMGLPIQIASEKESFLRSLDNFSEKEMILVDTPGLNYSDDRCFSKLKAIFGTGVETILLLSPASSREYLLDAANHFKTFNYDRIIITKVDECSHFGAMYDVLDEIGKPVSHMTTGQNVPRDIERATPERLAKLILQSRLN